MLEDILAEIRRMKMELAVALGTGGADDYPDYRQVVGKIEGLTLAESVIEEAIESRSLDN